MQTIEQIVEKIKEEDTVFNFYASALIRFLPFEHAKEFLEESFVKEVEAGNAEYKTLEITRDNVINLMKEYMDFAWEKAEDHRGLSAGRSISKFKAWVWVLGEENIIDWSNYAQYGCPILKQICDKYKFEIPDSDPLKNMIEGNPCGADYECGCGV